ncbi:hypothetical protein POVCU2_0023720 [Plasmodium ovale curtisi]|uniref:Uncharacterized protein n=1 Tax=Plasmodium ovale curtisi TaxID=864141 RepID=A0A1A8WJI6_PLAOA|nr:hypothetical protein POVCU2_0023720 [Plasmodium ovale curtisi]SBS91999.1 hypothetical protein POVCU1_021650 [Plasmodium ovale curtisi]
MHTAQKEFKYKEALSNPVDKLHKLRTSEAHPFDILKILSSKIYNHRFSRLAADSGRKVGKTVSLKKLLQSLGSLGEALNSNHLMMMVNISRMISMRTTHPLVLLYTLILANTLDLEQVGLNLFPAWIRGTASAAHEQEPDVTNNGSKKKNESVVYSKGHFPRVDKKNGREEF